MTSQPDEAISEDTFELTDEELQEVMEAEPTVSPISYMGTDFDVDGLVRRLNKGDIVVLVLVESRAILSLLGFNVISCGGARKWTAL